ncbi:hypothetical protein GMORB2_5197 [Geosmithia morbida]|uniref:DNA damage-responsive protein 48 n=1 Tax=Geosmithia morbida TaxID=1094350 RepID=A0A9P5D5G5_9HYPO|nr:uncharacterized protein GMORB2_5197 [Geosmithia morbida]KAF4124531.1 hypothetical protein GMORB2_5197 [Geosmithia morbida]
MDFINKAAESFSGNNDSNDSKDSNKSSGGGGFMDKLNNAAGGGAQGEKNEDGLDKAIDMFQEKVMKSGAQDNESAAEQAKDEMIADAIRNKYKEATGNEFPIEDKKKSYGL